jgi:hypothetical protein
MCHMLAGRNRGINAPFTFFPGDDCVDYKVILEKAFTDRMCFKSNKFQTGSNKHFLY